MISVFNNSDVRLWLQVISRAAVSLWRPSVSICPLASSQHQTWYLILKQGRRLHRDDRSESRTAVSRPCFPLQLTGQGRWSRDSVACRTPSAIILCCNHLLFISLSHHWPTVPYMLQLTELCRHAFIYRNFSCGPATAFQLGWGLDCDWAVAAPRSCSFLAVLLNTCSCAWDLCLVVGPSFSHTSGVRLMASCSLEYLEVLLLGC